MIQRKNDGGMDPEKKRGKNQSEEGDNTRKGPRRKARGEEKKWKVEQDGVAQNYSAWGEVLHTKHMLRKTQNAKDEGD